MSRHEGVSCDFCMKSNFRGRRYKCLICYDYDLCAQCYERKATSTRHTADHAVQCILTRYLLELSYGSAASARHLQSFTCPYCRKVGFSDATLLEHVTSEHSDSALEVICPVCCVLPGGEPNLLTDDLAEHLTLEHHRSGTFEFINEPSAIRHGGVRRISGRAAVGGVRTRRSNASFSPSTIEPTDRESVDLLAELQTTLTGGSRRQLQQLQVHMERQAVENRISSVSRRTASSSGTGSSSSSNPSSMSFHRLISGIISNGNSSRSGNNNTSSTGDNNFLTTINAAANGVSGGGNGTNSGVNGTTSAVPEFPAVPQLSLNARNPSAVNQLLYAWNASNNNNASTNANQNNATTTNNCQYLMSRFLMPNVSDEEQERVKQNRADRVLFMQELMLSTISELSQMNINEETGLDTSLGSGDAIAHGNRVEATDDNATVTATAHHVDESMKKNVNRRKEIPEDQITKKLKSKMSALKPI